METKTFALSLAKAPIAIGGSEQPDPTKGGSRLPTDRQAQIITKTTQKSYKQSVEKYVIIDLRFSVNLQL